MKQVRIEYLEKAEKYVACGSNWPRIVSAN